MSASLTDRRANFMASSKWARVMQGTSSRSSSMRSGFSARRFSFSMSRSIDSRIAYLHARWQISVISAPENPFVNCDTFACLKCRHHRQLLSQSMYFAYLDELIKVHSGIYWGLPKHSLKDRKCYGFLHKNHQHTNSRPRVGTLKICRREPSSGNGM